MTSLDYVTLICRDVGVKRRPQSDSTENVHVEHEAVEYHGQLHPFITQLMAEVLHAERGAFVRC